MRQLCTVSDHNYLSKGLALYESLKEHSKDFVLNYLCIDEKTFSFLKEYQSESLIVWNIKDVLESNIVLHNLFKNEYRYFCWSLASYFSNFLMKINNETITYIDSDILLHDNIDLLYNSFNNNDIGIFRHRQFPLNSQRPEGLFNVGIVYFKNTDLGKVVLNWWADAVLYKKYPHLSTCGDQKYLEEFVRLCPKNRIFVDGEIGHGAPWQWYLYDFSNIKSDWSIIWEGKKQKLVFSHFSQFKYNLENDTYIPSEQHHIYTPLENYSNIEGLKIIYDDYYSKIKQIYSTYYGLK